MIGGSVAVTDDHTVRFLIFGEVPEQGFERLPIERDSLLRGPSDMLWG